MMVLCIVEISRVIVLAMDGWRGTFAGDVGFEER